MNTTDDIMIDDSFLDDVVDCFNNDGRLKGIETITSRKYEYRVQQQQMAYEVALALYNNDNLCIEAPTGVGKSFAYLLPAILYATGYAKDPVVVSTETIHLQEQLINKDLPLLQDIIETKFTAALAKGKSNYICLKRFHFFIESSNSTLITDEKDLILIEKLKSWVENDATGDKSALPYNVDESIWSKICCESGNCRRHKCSFYRECFYWKIRNEWEKADILVVNHALFFTNLSLLEDDDIEHMLLPRYSAVVLDEAHTLEDSAANHLGLYVSDASLNYLIHRLYDEKTGYGLLAKPGQILMELRSQLVALSSKLLAFWRQLNNLFELQNSDSIRVKQQNIVPDTVTEAIFRFTDSVRKDYIKNLDSESQGGIIDEMEVVLNKLDAAAKTIFYFLTQYYPGYVYWFEKRGYKNSQGVALSLAPVNVAALLSPILFLKDEPVILTSATLTVNNNFNYYRSRVGFSAGREVVLDSPFDYYQQVKLHIPRDMVLPTEELYIDKLVENIKKFLTLTHGKAFVLFTSFQAMNETARRMEDFFLTTGINLMVQGENISRTAMVKQFKSDINSVIFGTSSFWTGVDVPGEALSSVMITKLPFSVPVHPLIQARVEALESQGQNSFMNFSLPEAVLKFKQGVGRLIRSKTDTGIIVILDKRVITKKYGKIFIDSIPSCPRG